MAEKKQRTPRAKKPVEDRASGSWGPFSAEQIRKSFRILERILAGRGGNG